MKYVMHKHRTKRGIHYDLRLEYRGALESWAVPKNPQLSKKQRILAVLTVPHAMSYGSFKGKIPQGHPGAGSVSIYDSGSYEIVKRKRKEWVFTLKGKKLKGEFCLINFKDKNWLFFRK